ncbi:MAG: DUF58 domain-containing protein [Candidatus Omnitrophica bacterium]|nr:DUF58 domain-containing protein [Candidatus Omnitrophota bacterium]
MIPKDIFEKVRRIEITTNRLVSDIFAGQYHSVFKGRGMEFDEVREYQIGDDIRSIDWNVTARTGIPYIKKFVEEREMTVMVMVDASPSCQFATVREIKAKLAAQIAAVLAFSAIRNNDKIGLVIFTDEIERFIPPRKGKGHVLRIIREVLGFEPRGRGTNIANVVEFFTKIMARHSVCFVISDFFEGKAMDLSTAPDFVKPMTIANRRHDMIAVTLNDPCECELPDCGLVSIQDAETNERVIVDTSDPLVRGTYHQRALMRLEGRERLFRSMGVDHIDIWTDVPYAERLIQFFAQRRKRQR